MTFKNQYSVHFCLCAPTHPLQTCHKISGVTRPKFTKILSDRQIIVGVNVLSNTSGEHKDAVCQFSPTRATNRLP